MVAVLALFIFAVLAFQNCAETLPPNGKQGSAVSGATGETGDADPYWANVVLLMHMDGTATAGIADASHRHPTIELVGGPVLSAVQSKFGGSSLFLNGHSYLRVASSTDWDLSGGDATIEAWIYWTPDPSSNFSGGYYAGIVAQSPVTADQNWLFAVGQGQFGLGSQFNGGGPDDVLSPSGTPSLASWHHIAVSKASGTTRLFVDGVEVAARTANPFKLSSQPLFVGAINTTSFADTFVFNGYIDELRITKGVARYKQNFLPPISPFPNR